MCGLVGIAGDLGTRHNLFMKRLLLLDYFRGTDSTGLAAIRSDRSTVLAKAAVNPITMFDMKSFDKALDGFASTAFIGHNRAATLGKVNDANAHPYQYGDITGAHNGTLDKASWERLELEAGIPTDTDSAAIFACIDAIGIDDTIKLMEKGRTSHTGAWALVWYNKVDNTINFIRNEHRPLWFAFNKTRDEMYWASEYEMLDAAGSLTKKEDFEGWWANSNDFSFFPFEQDRLYSVNLSDLVSGLPEKDLIKSIKGRKIEGREPAPFASTTVTPAKTGGAAPWEKKDGGTTHSTTSANNVVTMGKKPNTDLDDDISDFVAGRNTQVTTQERSKSHPLNNLISEARFNELAKFGCSYCGSDIDIDDSGYTIYDKEDVILCSECSGHDQNSVKLYLAPTN